MAKKIDFNKTVYELVKEYPELLDIMAEMGFSEIKKKPVLESMGRLMTIPKGAKMKNISMMDVVSTLMSKGFEIEGEMPTIEVGGQNSNVAEAESTPETRKEELKGYLRRLGEGEDLESVREDFVRKFSEVDASEIMEAEQEMMKEGTPLAEVQKLCDVHSALFHGTTAEEKNANPGDTEDDALMQKRIQDELAKRDSYPKKDYTDKNALAAELVKIKGHPLYTFSKENEALTDLLDRFKESREDDLLASIRELSIHYAKKGDLLYPHLKVKYGISGPSDVMWTVDDEIRDELRDLGKIIEKDAEWNNRLDAVLTRAEEMIYKEQNILFPICAVNFTDEEWHGIYHDSKDYDDSFGVENEVWDEAEATKAVKVSDRNIGISGEVVMPGGHMTPEQLTALLNTIPLEITFIDADNINRFFNEGPKVFKRPGMAIDREVFSCHPPKIEPIVRSIIDDFRNGVRDSVPLWMDKGGRSMLVTYMAVRDHNKEYLGTVEVVQDMEFAKEHFQK